MFDAHILRSNYPRLWDLFLELPKAQRDNILTNLGEGLDNTFTLFKDELMLYGDNDWEELLAQLIIGGATAYHPTAVVTPWAPTDISGCVLWLKADAITGLSDGDPVGTWEDQSDQGNDATQSTGAAKPVYKINQQNSLPTVYFDGADDFMRIDSLAAKFAGADTSFSYFGVAKVIDDAGDPHGQLFNVGRIASSTPLIYIAANRNSDYRWTRRDDAGSILDIYGNISPTGSYDLISHAFHGTTLDTWINGVVDQDATAWDRGTLTLDGVSLGNRVNNSGQWLKGNHAEIIVYDSGLSDEDVDIVESYLNTKWGLGL